MRVISTLKNFERMMRISVVLLGIQSVMTFLSIYFSVGHVQNETAQTMSLMILSVTMFSFMLLLWGTFREKNKFMQFEIWLIVLLTQLIFSNFIYCVAAFLTLYFNWDQIAVIVKKRDKFTSTEKLLTAVSICLVLFSGLLKYLLVML